jgi:hypothetical protein
MRPLIFFFMAVIVGIITYTLTWKGAMNQWFSFPTMSFELIFLNVMVTSGIYFWLARTKAPMLFMNSYLLSIVMKLIFYSFLLLLIRLMSPQALTGNAVLLLACYFIFTALEVAVLFRKVNR